MQNSKLDEVKQINLNHFATKGCGCFTIGFFVFFLWGIWTTHTTFSNVIELKATVNSTVEIEHVDLNARTTKYFVPVVLYKFNNTVYIDTLEQKKNSFQEYDEGALISVFIHPENPQTTTNDSIETYYFYIVSLIFAVICYLIYRLLKNPKKSFFNKN